MNGQNFLFYNATTGAGAVGRLEGDNFITTESYPEHSFSDWTHVSSLNGYAGNVLFYNANNGKGAIGLLDQGKFRTVSLLDDFQTGWTHIVSVPHHIPNSLGDFGSVVLFYNALTGAGALKFSPTIRTYTNGAFAIGWTHITPDSSGMLFYNAISGEGAIAIPIFVSKSSTDSNSGSTWNFLLVDDISTVKYYKSGEFSQNWTHIEPADFGIIFYNAADGSGATGKLIPRTGRPDEARGFETDEKYPSGYFGKQWSHCVTFGNSIFFYNKNTGEAVIMKKNDKIDVVRRYPENSFAQEWTHIVTTVDIERPK